MRLLIHWFISALSLMIVAYVVPGIHVKGVGTALIAAAVIGFVNSTLGLLLKILSFPFIVLTLGIVWFVINAMMLLFASALLRPDFEVSSFGSAFVGAIVLSLVNMVLRKLLDPKREDD
jgi:putative membrane protein